MDQGKSCIRNHQILFAYTENINIKITSKPSQYQKTAKQSKKHFSRQSMKNLSHEFLQARTTLTNGTNIVSKGTKNSSQFPHNNNHFHKIFTTKNYYASYVLSKCQRKKIKPTYQIETLCKTKNTSNRYVLHIIA